MDDTIAAISTAYGEGGIGIIRISGEKSADILKRIFSCQGQVKSRMMKYGRIIDPRDGSYIDEVMAVYMKAPKTYTREDIVEINCHGSMVSLRKILELVISCGARLAERGEFTQRAFLNGRLDLSQAEAVMDLISAKSDKSYDIALSQLGGQLSDRVKEIMKLLLDIQVDIAVNIDYPDEDIEELTYNKLAAGIEGPKKLIEDILATADSGRMIREGINIAILGKPNVGKSSLLNCLLRENRAIVTDIPGTTRDTIEEAVSIRDIPVNIVDTAGIRDTDDTVEQMGIEKSKLAFNRADYVIMVIDGSKPLSQEDLQLLDYVKTKKSLVTINKIDRGNVVVSHDIQNLSPNSDVILTSFTEGRGIDEIENIIEKQVYGGQVSQKDSFMVNNVRHISLLKSALEDLRDALVAVKDNMALDFVEIDIRDAYEKLGAITGETVSDDVLDEVFSRFCLGK